MEKGQKVEFNSWEAGGLDLPVPPPPTPSHRLYMGYALPLQISALVFT